MIKAIDLRKGKLVSHEGALYTVHTARHVAKGNKRSYIQARLKAVKGGNLIDVRFSVDDRIETPFIETKPFEFLYRDGDEFVLMDQQTYDQYSLERELVAEQMNYVTESLEGILGLIYNDECVGIQVPTTVELTISECDPGVKGNSATGRTKPATLETGLTVQVPEYLRLGERIKIDTRTGEFLSRAN